MSAYIKKIVSCIFVLVFVCGALFVSPSYADTLLDCGFDTIFEGDEAFNMGGFFWNPFSVGSDGGVAQGFPSAKVLTTKYSEDDRGVISHSDTTWLRYDAVARISIGGEDLGSSGDERSVCLTYYNDNPREFGEADGRSYVNFVLDIKNQRVYATIGAAGADDAASAVTDIITYTLDGTGIAWYDVGISVSEQRIRFFIDNQLIFDIRDSEDFKTYAGLRTESPVALYNRNNLLIVDRVTVTGECETFPENMRPAGKLVGISVVAEPLSAGDSKLTAGLVCSVDDGYYLSNLSVMLDWDDSLTLSEVESASPDSGITGDKPYLFRWGDGEMAFSGTEQLATLTFDIKSGAAALGDTFEITVLPGEAGGTSTIDGYVLGEDQILYTGVVAEAVARIDRKVSFRLVPVESVMPGDTEITVQLRAVTDGEFDVARCGFKISYPDTLTLKSAVKNNSDEALNHGIAIPGDLSGRPFLWEWTGGGAAFNGHVTLATLVFEIKDGAAEVGDSFDLGLACGDGGYAYASDGYCYNLSGTAQYNGALAKVREYALGDLDNDGNLNTSDIVVILRIIADWPDVSDHPEAGDVDGSGAVDIDDAVYYLRCLAGWEGYYIF